MSKVLTFPHPYLPHRDWEVHVDDKSHVASFRSYDRSRTHVVVCSEARNGADHLQYYRHLISLDGDYLLSQSVLEIPLCPSEPRSTLALTHEDVNYLVVRLSDLGHELGQSAQKFFEQLG